MHVQRLRCWRVDGIVVAEDEEVLRRLLTVLWALVARRHSAASTAVCGCRAACPYWPHSLCLESPATLHPWA